MKYYERLGVSPQATVEEIKRAYRALALRLHPDVNPDPEATQIFQKIVEAYSVLSDPLKRQVYDQTLPRVRRQHVPPHHHSMNDLFEEILKQFSNQYASQQIYPLTVTAKDLLVVLHKRVIFETGFGQHSFWIDLKGVTDGMVCGYRTNNPAFPIVHISYKFDGEGIWKIINQYDLETKITVPSKILRKGGVVNVRLLTGTVPIEFEPNSKLNGLIVKVLNWGLHREDGSRGDIFLRVFTK